MLSDDDRLLDSLDIDDDPKVWELAELSLESVSDEEDDGTTAWPDGLQDCPGTGALFFVAKKWMFYKFGFNRRTSSQFKFIFSFYNEEWKTLCVNAEFFSF